jgi:hypothetical protein
MAAGGVAQPAAPQLSKIRKTSAMVTDKGFMAITS